MTFNKRKQDFSEILNLLKNAKKCTIFYCTLWKKIFFNNTNMNPYEITSSIKFYIKFQFHLLKDFSQCESPMLKRILMYKFFFITIANIVPTTHKIISARIEGLSLGEN